METREYKKTVEVKADIGGYPYLDYHIDLYDYKEDKPIFKPGEKVIIRISRI